MSLDVDLQCFLVHLPEKRGVRYGHEARLRGSIMIKWSLSFEILFCKEESAVSGQRFLVYSLVPFCKEITVFQDESPASHHSYVQKRVGVFFRDVWPHHPHRPFPYPIRSISIGSVGPSSVNARSCIGTHEWSQGQALAAIMVWRWNLITMFCGVYRVCFF